MERRRSQALGAELEAERRRGHSLEAELEAERRRSHMLGVELEAEKRRSHSLEVELEVERRRSLRLGEELETERRRGQAKGAGPDGEKPAEEVRRRPLGDGAALSPCCPQEVTVSPRCPPVSPPQTPLLLRAQLSALSHILTLQERELNREVRTGGALGCPRHCKGSPKATGKPWGGTGCPDGGRAALCGAVGETG